MNFLDLVFCLLAAYFGLRGLMRGFFIELGGIAGVVLGFFMANRHHQELTPLVRSFINLPDWETFIAYLVIFAGCIVLVTLLAQLLHKLVPPMVAWVNKLAGLLVGLAKAALICVVIFLVLSEYVPQSSLITYSNSAPFLSQAADLLRPFLPEELSGSGTATPGT